jgi:hypothetical protein
MNMLLYTIICGFILCCILLGLFSWWHNKNRLTDTNKKEWLSKPWNVEWLKIHFSKEDVDTFINSE